MILVTRSFTTLPTRSSGKDAWQGSLLHIHSGPFRQFDAVYAENEAVYADKMYMWQCVCANMHVLQLHVNTCLPFMPADIPMRWLTGWAMSKSIPHIFLTFLTYSHIRRRQPYRQFQALPALADMAILVESGRGYQAGTSFGA